MDISDAKIGQTVRANGLHWYNEIQGKDGTVTVIWKEGKTIGAVFKDAG